MAGIFFLNDSGGGRKATERVPAFRTGSYHFARARGIEKNGFHFSEVGPFPLVGADFLLIS